MYCRRNDKRGWRDWPEKTPRIPIINSTSLIPVLTWTRLVLHWSFISQHILRLLFLRGSFLHIFGDPCSNNNRWVKSQGREMTLERRRIILRQDGMVGRTQVHGVRSSSTLFLSLERLDSSFLCRCHSSLDYYFKSRGVL